MTSGCCDGRVVKALDLKSNGIFPRRFEPCSQRYFFTFILFFSSRRFFFVKSDFVIFKMLSKWFMIFFHKSLIVKLNNAELSKAVKYLNRWK